MKRSMKSRIAFWRLLRISRALYEGLRFVSKSNCLARALSTNASMQQLGREWIDGPLHMGLENVLAADQDVLQRPFNSGFAFL